MIQLKNSFKPKYLDPSNQNTYGVKLLLAKARAYNQPDAWFSVVELLDYRSTSHDRQKLAARLRYSIGYACDRSANLPKQEADTHYRTNDGQIRPGMKIINSGKTFQGAFLAFLDGDVQVRLANALLKLEALIYKQPGSKKGRPETLAYIEEQVIMCRDHLDDDQKNQALEIIEEIENAAHGRGPLWRQLSRGDYRELWHVHFLGPQPKLPTNQIFKRPRLLSMVVMMTLVIFYLAWSKASFLEAKASYDIGGFSSLAKYITQPDKRGDAFFHKAFYAINKNDYERAEVALNLVHHSSHWEKLSVGRKSYIYFLLSRLHQRKGDYLNSLDFALQSTALLDSFQMNPEDQQEYNARLYHQLARIYLFIEMPQQAIEALDSAIESLDHESLDYIVNRALRAYAYTQMLEYQNAFDILIENGNGHLRDLGNLHLAWVAGILGYEQCALQAIASVDTDKTVDLKNNMLIAQYTLKNLNFSDISQEMEYANDPLLLIEFMKVAEMIEAESQIPLLN